MPTVLEKSPGKSASGYGMLSFQMSAYHLCPVFERSPFKHATLPFERRTLNVMYSEEFKFWVPSIQMFTKVEFGVSHTWCNTLYPFLKMSCMRLSAAMAIPLDKSSTFRLGQDIPIP